MSTLPVAQHIRNRRTSTNCLVLSQRNRSGALINAAATPRRVIRTVSPAAIRLRTSKFDPPLPSDAHDRHRGRVRRREHDIDPPIAERLLQTRSDPRTEQRCAVDRPINLDQQIDVTTARPIVDPRAEQPDAGIRPGE